MQEQHEFRKALFKFAPGMSAGIRVKTEQELLVTAVAVIDICATLVRKMAECMNVEFSVLSRTSTYFNETCTVSTTAECRISLAAFQEDIRLNMIAGYKICTISGDFSNDSNTFLVAEAQPDVMSHIVTNQ